MENDKIKLKEYDKLSKPSAATLERVALKKKEDYLYASTHKKNYGDRPSWIGLLIDELANSKKNKIPYLPHLVGFIQYKLVCGAIVILKLKDKFFNLFKMKSIQLNKNDQNIKKSSHELSLEDLESVLRQIEESIKSNKK